MKQRHSIASTLTARELARELQAGEPTFERIAGPTRLNVEIDGDAFAETDLASGYTLRIGSISRDINRTRMETGHAMD